MIIAVGFKVNNQCTVQFRRWINSIVKDYTIKDWDMYEDRLKTGGSILTEKYFEELLEKNLYGGQNKEIKLKSENQWSIMK